MKIKLEIRMKHFYFALIATWLSLSIANANVVPMDSEGQLRSDDNDVVEVVKNSDCNECSWIQKVIVIACQLINGQSNIVTVENPCCSNGAATPTPQPTITTTTTTESPVTPEECQSGFIKLGDQCYYFSQTKETWSDALRSCMNLEADLVHPMGSEEDALVTTYLKDNHKGTPRWWIGGTDQYEGSSWVWAHDKSPMSYTNWIIGEPNNDNKDNNCAHYWQDHGYQWNDVACTYEYQYICQQKDSNEVTIVQSPQRAWTVVDTDVGRR